MAGDGVQVTGVGVNLVPQNPAWLDGMYSTSGDLPSAVQNPSCAAWVGSAGSLSIYYSNGVVWSTSQGQQGPQGPTGNAATVSIGTTSSLPAGSSATVANSGSSSAAIFDFGIPTGLQGLPGVNSLGVPVSRTIVLATAYQATTPSKPALLSIIVDLSVSITIGSTANTVELIVGPTNAVASGTGTLADSWRNDLSVTLITINLAVRQKMTAVLPANYWFAVRRTSGTGITIASAYDQAVG